MATSDVIANDVVGLGLLKTLGTIPKIQNRSVWKQPQIRRAVELGLGVKSKDQIGIKSDGVKEIEKGEITYYLSITFTHWRSNYHYRSN